MPRRRRRRWFAASPAGSAQKYCIEFRGRGLPARRAGCARPRADHLSGAVPARAAAALPARAAGYPRRRFHRSDFVEGGSAGAAARRLVSRGSKAGSSSHYAVALMCAPRARPPGRRGGAFPRCSGEINRLRAPIIRRRARDRLDPRAPGATGEPLYARGRVPGGTRCSNGWASRCRGECAPACRRRGCPRRST